MDHEPEWKHKKNFFDCFLEHSCHGHGPFASGCDKKEKY